MARYRLGALLVLGFCFLAALGCGPTHFQPTVKIMKGGSELALSKDGHVEVALFAEADKDCASPEAVSKEDGVYKVKGRLGTGVPAGKYKLSVVVKDPYTANAKDILEGKYARQKGFPVEVKDSATEIVVDVSK